MSAYICQIRIIKRPSSYVRFSKYLNMDLVTSKHGLAPIYPTQPLDAYDVNKLSYDLTLELERLTQLFTVDAQKLKEISQKFEKELQDGMAVFLCLSS